MPGEATTVCIAGYANRPMVHQRDAAMCLPELTDAYSWCGILVQLGRKSRLKPVRAGPWVRNSTKPTKAQCKIGR